MNLFFTQYLVILNMSNPVVTNNEGVTRDTEGSSPYEGIPTTEEYIPSEHGVPTHLWNPKTKCPERNPVHPMHSSPQNPFYEIVDVRKSWCERLTGFLQTNCVALCIAAVVFLLLIVAVVIMLHVL